MIKSLHLLLVLLCLSVCVHQAPVLAAEVTGLYQNTVPVTSRDDERARVRAFSTALRAVLIKLTGHEDLNTNSTLAAALSAPAQYVETWSYRTVNNPETGAATLELDVSFYQAEVQKLLNNAGTPLWPTNRPETLVWLVLQEDSGLKFFADPSTGDGQEFLASLQVAADKRGLPLSLPLLDFDDQRALRPEQIWDLELEAMRLASARYRMDSILAIRVLPAPNGQVSAKLTHVFREQIQELELPAVTADEVFNRSTALVARHLADNFAVLLSSQTGSSAPAQELRLTIEGVVGVSDYAALLAYLNKVPGVSALQMREVEGDKLQFSLQTAGQVRQLIENLALDRRLQPVIDASQMPTSDGLALAPSDALQLPAPTGLVVPSPDYDGNVQLHYRWQP